MAGAREEIFDLSAEARYFIETTATAAAEAAAEAAVQKLVDARHCPLACEEMVGVRQAIEDPRAGLRTRVATLEEQVGNLVWWMRATVVSAIGAVASVIVSLIR